MVTVKEVDYSKYNKAVQFTFFKKMGKVINVVGLTIESAGPDAKLGDLCRIIPKSEETGETSSAEILAEVVGFKDKKTLSYISVRRGTMSLLSRSPAKIT